MVPGFRTRSLTDVLHVLGDGPHKVQVGGESAVPGLAQVRLDVNELHRAR